MMAHAERSGFGQIHGGSCARMAIPRHGSGGQPGDRDARAAHDRHRDGH